MRVIPIVQGSPEWHAHRATARNASEAPMVMGDSNYGTRDDLLRRMVSGVAPEVTPWQQKIFDRGHAVEPVLRAYAEQIIGEALSPLCATSDDGYLSCSFDGVTFMGDTNAEFKQANKQKMADIEAGILPLTDKWQVVQGFAVNDEAQACIYVCGDGSEENTRHLIVNRVDYEADIERLRAGWAQLDEDRKTYVVEPKQVTPAGATPETLPALRIEARGEITTSNLNEFREHAMAVLADINTDLQTDQDFADAEATVKWCKRVEDRIKSTKESILSQMSTVDDAVRALDDVSEETRRIRLDLSKIVKAEKENRKAEIIKASIGEVLAHCEQLSKSLGEYRTPAPDGLPQRFGAAIKGRSSLDSMRAECAQLVANLKIEANAQADRVRACVVVLTEHATEHMSLFPDRQALAWQKDPDDLKNLVLARIAEHKEREAKRLEAERARIRAEEERRAQAAAEAERQRIAAEERAKTQAEAALAAAQQEKNNVDAAIVDAGILDLGSATATPAPAAQGRHQAQDAPQQAAPAAPQAAASNAPTLKLGDINKRLAPLSISGAGLAEFDIEPLATDKNAKLYSEAQLQELLNKIVEHIVLVNRQTAAEQLEAV